MKLTRLLPILLCAALTLGLVSGFALLTHAYAARVAEVQADDEEDPGSPGDVSEGEVTPDDEPLPISCPNDEHEWDEGSVDLEPSCTQKGIRYYHCVKCQTGEKTEPIPALGHDFGSWIRIQAPTCTDEGRERRTCQRCGMEEQRAIQALGHNYREDVTEPTCTAGGFTTYICKRCGLSYVGDETGALGHDWDAGVVTVEPTPLSSGEKTFTCQRCGLTRVEELPPATHDHEYEQTTVEPTCAEEGYTLYTCVICGASYKDGYVPALGHVYGEWVVKSKPTCIQTGLKQRVCERCGGIESQTVPANGHHFVKGVCTVCGAVDYGYQIFKDVKESDYFYVPVYWAVEHSITEGISETRFGPKMPCIRTQVVTFLWRAAGEPMPKIAQSPFRDVKPSAYYYYAVLWAVENGITNGMSKTIFGTNEPCSRAQVVTFLWRFAGKPTPDDDVEIRFEDVNTGTYYYEPVRWAVEQHITEGMTATEFRPKEPCTRAQIVTFLYRALAFS